HGTPFTTNKAVDYEDFEREVGFLHQCGAHGMVWPQLASEYWLVSKEERMRGMSVFARAAKEKKPALVLAPDAIIPSRSTSIRAPSIRIRRMAKGLKKDLFDVVFRIRRSAARSASRVCQL